MSAWDPVWHWNVNVLGASFLRLQRLRSRRALERTPEHPHLAPPLETGPRLKELISRHYLKGRHAEGRRPVAWVTSGAPAEFLNALGFCIIYPENHGAVCGIRRVAEGLCGKAEDAGWSRDVCSYARTDIGAALSGETPVGKLPRPDLLLCCTNICQTVLYWYRVLGRHFQAPVVVIDTPFLYGAEAPEHAVDYVRRQIEEAVQVAQNVAGRDLTHQRLREVTRLSKQAIELWGEILSRGRAHPAPLTAFDEFIHLAPVVEMRGEAFTVDYYAAMLAALDERVKKGIGAVKKERRRLVWDNLPVWARVRWLSEKLAERGASLVASTYTNAWAELAPMVDPEKPVESAARVYLHPILNRGPGHKLEVMRRMVRDFGAHGVLLHSDRSCKPYSIGQMDQRERLAADGVPALLLEADHNDPRAFSEEQTATRLAAFLEVLEA